MRKKERHMLSRREMGSLSLAMLSAACSGSEGDLSAPNGRGKGTISEEGFRRLALLTPKPQYPLVSIENGVSGVAVAEVTTSKNGRVDEVNVLQAPDTHIRKAVEEALMNWELRQVQPDGFPEPVQMSSKVTFYFRIDSGRGSVWNPEELGGGSDNAPGASVGSGTVATEIDEAELQGLLETTKPIILDVRERGAFARHHRDGAVNIPAGEVAARAATELPLSSHIVVDCYSELGPICPYVGELLSRQGFSRVSLLVRDGSGSPPVGFQLKKTRQ